MISAVCTCKNIIRRRRTVSESNGYPKKENCWEFKKCGREVGGTQANHLGECPVSSEDRLHGAQGGQKAGRACWVIAGTLCGGKVQGTFARKYENCKVCEFYKKVRKEESGDFQMSITLLTG